MGGQVVPQLVRPSPDDARRRNLLPATDIRVLPDETPDGYVVMTQDGDSPVNLEPEQTALLETPKRRSQVDRLRQAMADAGWTELGVDGEWYEYVFGQ